MSTTATLTTTATIPAPAEDVDEDGPTKRRPKYANTYGTTVDMRTFLDRIASNNNLSKTVGVRDVAQNVVQGAFDTLGEGLLRLLQHVNRQQANPDHVRALVKIIFAQQPDAQSELLAAIDAALDSYREYQGSH